MADVKTSKVDTTTDMEHTDDQKFVVPGASLTPPPLYVSSLRVPP